MCQALEVFLLPYAPNTPRIYDRPEGMRHPWLPLVVLVALLLIPVGIWAWHQRPEPQPTAITSGRPATEAEQAELTALIEHAAQVQSHGRNTGDISAFPSVYINDPSVHLHPDMFLVRDDDPDGYKALLASVNWQQVNAKPGFLDLNIAQALRLHRDGPPYWGGVGKPIVVYAIVIDGVHAGAVSRLAEGGGTREHYVFTRVDNHWRISSIWTFCMPGGCA
jgi:hypothetical protein